MAVKRWQPSRPQEVDANGNPYSGGKYNFYVAGSSTRQDTFTTSAATVANANPVVLDSSGRPQTEIWLTVGQTYKCVFTTSADVTVWTEESITGINDAALTLDEWVSGPAPTYVSSTSFTLVGDQTSTFTPGRRVKVTDSGGTKYGTIKTSAYTSLTTITLDQTSDALATPTSAVSYGLLQGTIDSSTPVLPANFPLRGDATDRSKLLDLDLSAIPTGTTRRWTAQSVSGTVALTSEFAYLGLPSSSGRLLLPNNYISGFTLTNNGTAGMDVAAGQAMDSTNASNIIGAAIANKTQASWVAGTAAGGKLSAAAMANNTWYYWFAIYKTSDGTVDYGFDVATTPTLPSGYSKYRYIGARKTQSASTNWDTFIQHGDEVLWSTPPALDLNGALTSANRVLTTVNVPAVKVKWFGHARVTNGGSTDTGLILTDPACADVAPSVTATPLGSVLFANGSASTLGVGAQASCWTNTSSQIGVRGITTATAYIVTLGWIDPRGKPV